MRTQSPVRVAALLTATGAALAGCDQAPPAQLPAAQPVAEALSIAPGHLVGQALVGSEQFEADGLLTPDGELRLHLYQQVESKITVSAQLVTHVTLLAGRAQGEGRLVGQRCSAMPPSRFCGRAWSADIDLRALAGAAPHSTGDITVMTPAGAEVWWLTLGYWGGLPGGQVFGLATLDGLYRETLADFAAGNDVIVSLDGEGRLFFQSSATGCVGNGRLSPPFADVGIYRAELTIAGCRADRAALNAEFAGLATFETITPWDYAGFGPKLWLSAREDSAVALTTFAEGL
jgi:hypothetical protein